MSSLIVLTRLSVASALAALFCSMNVSAQSELRPQSANEIASIPATKVVNLNNPYRVPNQYIVVFKDGSELAKDVPVSMAHSLEVAPGILPTTDEGVKQIGLAMAARYRSGDLVRKNTSSNLRHIYTNVFHGFSIDGISEKNIIGSSGLSVGENGVSIKRRGLFL